MRYIQGQILLNKQETADFEFALATLKQDQNTRGDASEDKKSVRAYRTVREVAVRLGVINE